MSDSDKFGLDVVAQLKMLPISPWSSILVVGFVTCLLTRIITGLQSKQQAASKVGSKDITLVPYWVPFLGHAFTLWLRYQDFLSDASKFVEDGVARLCVAGESYIIVTTPSVTRRVLHQRSSTTTRENVLQVMELGFGDGGASRRVPHAILFGEPHQVILGLTRDPFLKHAVGAVVKSLEERVSNLISFSSSPIDQSTWERAAGVSVVNSPDGAVAEADFGSLVRYFTGALATDVLMGRDFIVNHPDVISDMFELDNCFLNLLAGIPRWVPGMNAGYSARDRLHRAIADHQQALKAVLDDRDPGSNWGSMSDVSSVMMDRMHTWRKLGMGPELSVPGDAGVLWAMNVNSNQLIFWILWHVYQNAELRADIVKELAPFVQQEAVQSDFPIAEPPRLSIDLDGILGNCPLIKAAYFEAIRLEAATISIANVTDTFSVTESVEDAALAGKSQPKTYTFPRGSRIMMPHLVHAKDGRYFKDPHTFNPRRFLVQSNKEDKTAISATNMTMGTLTAFGGGASMCKGKSFAERELLAISAAILTIWDVEPVGDVWPELGRKPCAGTYATRRDFRVRIKKRETAAQ